MEEIFKRTQEKSYECPKPQNSCGASGDLCRRHGARKSGFGVSSLLGRLTADVVWGSKQLSDRFRCIAVDLRGWGKSDRHNEDYNLFTQADDVEGVIEELNLMDFVFVGHSMGGKIAQILAGRRPVGLRAVLLVAPAPPTPLNVPDTQKQSMLNSYTTPEGIGDALKVISHKPLTLAQRLQVTEDSLGGAQTAKVAWISHGMGLDISKESASITVPICVIVGSEDQVEKEAALREAFLPLVPHAKFETIAGVGHLSPLEGSDEVAEVISDFLAEQQRSANEKGRT